MTRRFLPLLALGLLAAAAGLPAPAAALGPQASLVEGTVVVPADFQNRQFVVSATINGYGPYRLLVDTGASVCVLTPSLAAAVGARPGDPGLDQTTAANALSNPVTVRPVTLDEVALGGARFRGVPAVVNEDLGLWSRVAGNTIDGMIGFSLFADVVVALDFPGRRLVLGNRWPEGLPPVQSTLPLQLFNAVPVVTAETDRSRFELIVDTGANGSLNLAPAWTDAVPWQEPARPGNLVLALGTLGREQVGRIGTDVHLGDVVLDRPVAAIHPGTPSIGLGLLQNFCVVFDTARETAWLCAGARTRVPSPPVKTLGLNLVPDPEGWRVAATIPGSPAEAAGIAPGDLVTTIEGQAATNWSRTQLDDWTGTHPSAQLRIVRGPAARDLALPAWTLVP